MLFSFWVNKSNYYNHEQQEPEEEDIYGHVEDSEKIYDDIVQCTRQVFVYLFLY